MVDKVELEVDAVTEVDKVGVSESGMVQILEQYQEQWDTGLMLKARKVDLPYTAFFSF